MIAPGLLGTLPVLRLLAVLALQTGLLCAATMKELRPAPLQNPAVRTRLNCTPPMLCRLPWTLFLTLP